jgi:hypothetical protein
MRLGVRVRNRCATLHCATLHDAMIEKHYAVDASVEAARRCSPRRNSAKPLADHRLLEARHNFLTEQAHRLDHLRVRDQPAAIQLGQNAVDAEFVAQV